MKVKPNNYINEDQLFQLLSQWKSDKLLGLKMSEELCHMFYKICDGILKKSNYIRLDQDIKDEIKSNAMLNLILYIHNFKVEKSKSSHAAFTYVTFSIETSYKGSLKKMNEKKDRLPLTYNSDLIENNEVADLDF